MSNEELLQYVATNNAMPNGTSWEAVHELLKTHVQNTLQLAADNHTGDQQTFTSENAYLMEQFELLDGPPFTLQRLVEIVIDPYRYHVVGEKNKDNNGAGDTNSPLRGEKLQSALRRCILVSPYENQM